MRSILAGLVLILLPSLASAECTCTCIRGQATAICRPQALVEPICQQICTDKIEQSLGPVGGSGGGGLGGVGIGGIGSAIGGAVGSGGIGSEAGTSVGTGIADGVVIGDIDALSRANNSFDRTTNSQLGR